MILSYDILLGITLMFLLIIYTYLVYINEEKFNFAVDFFHKVNLMDSDNIQEDRSAMFDKRKDKFLGKRIKKEITKPVENIEIELKLKKCNQQLNRSLKTLSYISLMEADTSANKTKLGDLKNLKQNVQYEVLRITKQISNYRSQIENSIAA